MLRDPCMTMRQTLWICRMGDSMAYIGQVQRLGVGQPALPAALLVFDDALIFARLRVGSAMGLGMRAGKKDQAAIQAITEVDGLTPELVMDRWPHALNIPTAEIVEARLGRSIQGLLVGAQSLEIRLQNG